MKLFIRTLTLVVTLFIIPTGCSNNLTEIDSSSTTAEQNSIVTVSSEAQDGELESDSQVINESVLSDKKPNESKNAASVQSSGNKPTADSSTGGTSQQSPISSKPTIKPAETKLVPAVEVPTKLNGVFLMQYLKQRSKFTNSVYRLLNDKQLTVAYIGGSVTDGTGAADINKCWRAQTDKWLSEAFPDAEIKSIKASVGGTGSGFGMYRIENDMFKNGTPDLIFIEFSVNDNFEKYSEQEIKIQIETIYRKIYAKNPYADIIMIYVTDNGRGNDEVVSWHEEIADKYAINAIFLSDLIYDQIKFTGNPFSEYFADGVHPNDKGYDIYAIGVKSALSNLLNGKADNKVAKALPAASSGLKLNARIYKAVSTDLKNASGWTVDRVKFSWLGSAYGGSINASAKNSCFTLNFNGTDFGMLWERATDISTIEYSIDNGAYQTATGYLDYSNPVQIMLAKDLPNGNHTVTVRLKDAGKRCSIAAFLVAGELI